jgi:hypothetical protein
MKSLSNKIFKWNRGIFDYFKLVQYIVIQYLYLKNKKLINGLKQSRGRLQRRGGWLGFVWLGK